MCEEDYDYPYDYFLEDDYFPEDDDELAKFDRLDDEDKFMIDAFRDEFPEEGDWEDEEEVSILNGD